MKVFISWSGERSKLVAELLDEWIQCVIQAVEPWMSSKDIDRGALWFNKISDQLADTNVGILCLTKENRNKPWILFEAGALAKGISSSRVCTFLIDLEATDIENPLAQFNHTLPTKGGIWSLVSTINISLEDLSLKENVLEQVFETYWPKFDEKFHKILSNTSESSIKDTRPKNDIMLEVLSTVRTLDRRMRNLENINNAMNIASIIGKKDKKMQPFYQDSKLEGISNNNERAKIKNNYSYFFLTDDEIKEERKKLQNCNNIYLDEDEIK
jgi:hypothetical protein